MVKLLDGVKVLDFTHIHAGPLCTYQLALIGASVTKVEVPISGNQMRTMGVSAVPGMSTGFLGQNANKRSIAINLKHERGLHLAEELIQRAHVIVANLRPGVADKLGISFDRSKQIKPDIVYCAISGYGQDGPESDQAAMDHLMQGESGMFMATGTEQQPIRVGFAVADACTAIFSSSAIAAALYRKAQTGDGAYLDVSMLECCMALMGLNYYGFLATGQVMQRPGPNPLSKIGSVGTWETVNGLLMVNANSYRGFERMAQVLGLPELVDDPRFTDIRSLAIHCDEIRTTFGELFKTNTATYWDEKLRSADVPSGCARTPDETVNHPQLHHRGTLTQIDNVPGMDGPLRFLGAGFLVDGEPCNPKEAPPLLGQHTDEILAELSMSSDLTSELKTQKIVA